MRSDDGELAQPLVPGAKKDLDPESMTPLTGTEGLTTEQARSLALEWGPNALPENKKSKVRFHADDCRMSFRRLCSHEFCL